jgi:cis-3-alkyl-4-acyloxetan-2-one decarboxylase
MQPLPGWIQEQLPPGVERTLVPIGDHQIHVMTWGQGRPVILFHGNPTWSFLWRKVVAELLDEPVQLICPDLLGLGCSSRPSVADMGNLDVHQQIMHDLVTHLDLRDAVFVGQDWGGPIGLLAFSRQPERLAGMVILNTVVGPPKQDFKATTFHKFAQTPLLSDVAFRVLGFPQNALHTAQGDRSSIRGSVARAYRWPLRGLKRNAAPLALARMVPDSWEHPSVPKLQECQALVTGFEGPSAIVWGDQDPILGRLRRRTERLMPNAEVTATDAGHFLQEEVPAKIAAGVRSVLRRLG